jgi:predicted ATPase/DNA-binding CsgD family transcriptional regulator
MLVAERALVGRSSELRRIGELLADRRVLTLTGPGGSGKTTLARAVAEAWPGGGSAFVDVSSITAGDRLPSTVAASLKLAETAETDAAAAIADWAAGDGAKLLVLDNLEQVDRPEPSISAFLAGSGSLRILATSRIPIGIDGAAELPIGPLELPAADDPAAVESSPAGALFLARARAVGELLTLDRGSSAAVARLVHRLDGVPLALELAAARSRVLRPSEILERLTAHDPSVLRRSGGDPRQRSLAEVIAWSLELLPAAARQVLGQVASATGRFDVELAEAIVDGDDVLEALDTLLAFGLVVRDRDDGPDGPSRFRILDAVREAAATDDPGPRRRHAAAMVRRVEAAVGGIDVNAESALRRLDADADNVRLALDWAAGDAPDLGLELASVAYPYWTVRGRLREGLEILRGALAAASAEAPFRARAHGGVSRLLSQLFGEPAALDDGREAARLGRETGDPDAEIEGLQSIVWMVFVPGFEVDLAEIRAARERAAELIVGASPDRRFRARQVILAALAHEHGLSSDEVLAQLAAAIADAEAGGNRMGVAKLRGNRALSHVTRGAFAPALADAQAALEIFRSLGDPYHESWAMNTVVLGASGTGDLATLGDGLARSRELAVAAVAAGTPYDIADLLTMGAVAAALIGELESSARLAGLAATLVGGLIETPTNAWILERARRELGDLAWTVAGERVRGRDPLELFDEFAALVDERRKRAGVAPRAVSGARPEPRLRHGTLTRREIEILRLLADGRSDPEIAEALFISPKTASVHVSNVKAKLGVETRLEAALRARELGFGS